MFKNHAISSAAGRESSSLRGVSRSDLNCNHPSLTSRLRMLTQAIHHNVHLVNETSSTVAALTFLNLCFSLCVCNPVVSTFIPPAPGRRGHARWNCRYECWSFVYACNTHVAIPPFAEASQHLAARPKLSRSLSPPPPPPSQGIRGMALQRPAMAEPGGPGGPGPAGVRLRRAVRGLPRVRRLPAPRLPRPPR